MTATNRRNWALKGFSLVEMALAIGIIAFALLIIVGLLPVARASLQSANAESRAVDTLNFAATAVRSQYYLGTSTAPFYSLANYLTSSDPATVAADTTSPWSTHTKYSINGATSNYTFGILNDGSIKRATDTTAASYQLFIRVVPPADNLSPVLTYLSVAWPGSATYIAGTGWSGQQGYVETVIYANLPSAN